MIRLLEDTLRARWTALFPQSRTPNHLHLAVLSTSREAVGNRILLVFADHDYAPALVGRIPRDPRATGRLEREWHTLELLHATLTEEVAAAIPKPVEKRVLCGNLLTLQTGMPGRNLKTLLQRGERPLEALQTAGDLDQIERWLQGFQAVPPPVSLPAGLDLPDERNLVSELERVLPVLEQAGLITTAQAAGLLAMAEPLEAHACAHPVWVHGDLWPGNVLVEGDRWSILDWDGVALGAPWTDRFWFALHYGMLCHAQLLGRPDLGEGLRRTLFMDHPISDTVRGWMRRVVSGEGLSEQAPREIVAVLLATEAGRMLVGRSRGRAFDRAAPAILREWMGYPEQVRL